MMARGFKPVGWVAGVATAALGCYMLSLNVASERNELAKLERSIVLAKRDIRTLQTELETRGRLQQLENWNANVLALSAPTSAQFLENELTLARFDQREQTIEQRTPVHMASAPAQQAPAVQQKIEAPVRYASAPVAEKPSQPLVHRASLIVEDERPVYARTAATPAKAVAVETKTATSAKPAIDAKKTSTFVKSASVEKKIEGKKSAGEKLAKDGHDKAQKAGGAGGQ